MESRAYRLYTEEGSRYIARFDPQVVQGGITYGRMVVVGYSEVAEKHLRIVGIAPEPEAGGHLIIEDKPWSIEMVDGEAVPLYEYENISLVKDITHVLESIYGKTEQEV